MSMADETHTVRGRAVRSVASRQDDEPSRRPLQRPNCVAAPPCPEASCAAASDVREGQRPVGEGIDATPPQP
jgi:hypothetical protein